MAVTVFEVLLGSTVPQFGQHLWLEAEPPRRESGQTERNRSRAARLQMEQDLGRGTTRRGSYKTLLNKIREMGLEN